MTIFVLLLSFLFVGFSRKSELIFSPLHALRGGCRLDNDNHVKRKYDEGMPHVYLTLPTSSKTYRPLQRQGRRRHKKSLLWKGHSVLVARNRRDCRQTCGIASVRNKKDRHSFFVSRREKNSKQKRLAKSNRKDSRQKVQKRGEWSNCNLVS